MIKIYNFACVSKPLLPSLPDAFRQVRMATLEILKRNRTNIK